jgi:hypothetical protein
MGNGTSDFDLIGNIEVNQFNWLSKITAMLESQ